MPSSAPPSLRWMNTKSSAFWEMFLRLNPVDGLSLLSIGGTRWEGGYRHLWGSRLCIHYLLYSVCVVDCTHHFSDYRAPPDRMTSLGEGGAWPPGALSQPVCANLSIQPASRSKAVNWPECVTGCQDNSCQRGRGLPQRLIPATVTNPPAAPPTVTMNSRM